MTTYVYTVRKGRALVPVARATWPDGAVTCLARAQSIFTAHGHTGGIVRELSYAQSLKGFCADALSRCPTYGQP